MRPFFKFASAHQVYMESSSSLPLHDSRLSLQFSLQKNIQLACTCTRTCPGNSGCCHLTRTTLDLLPIT